VGHRLLDTRNVFNPGPSYFLTLTSFQPLYGKLSDIFGRKPALLFGYAIFGLGCLFCGLARNMNELIAARVRFDGSEGKWPRILTVSDVRRHRRWGHDYSRINPDERHCDTSRQRRLARSYQYHIRCGRWVWCSFGYSSDSRLEVQSLLMYE